MSKQSWENEFYAIDASTLGKLAEDKPLALTDHSLKKWRGLRPDNLQKHGLVNPPIEINAFTCALCYAYDYDGCLNCPLARHLGHPCDDPGEAETFDSLLNKSPFAMWATRHDPEPMIDALEGAMQMLEREAGEPT